MAQATNPYATIGIGALPPDDGISMAFGPGGPDATFLNKGICYSVPIVLNGKHTDQQVVADALNAIHAALTMTKTYPSTSEYQITNISTISAPSYLDREQNSQWLYGSSLMVRFYYFN